MFHFIVDFICDIIFGFIFDSIFDFIFDSIFDFNFDFTFYVYLISMLISCLISFFISRSFYFHILPTFGGHIFLVYIYIYVHHYVIASMRQCVITSIRHYQTDFFGRGRVIGRTSEGSSKFVGFVSTVCDL